MPAARPRLLPALLVPALLGLWAPASAQTPPERWYGAFAGSEILGRTCTVTGGSMDIRTRFGVPSFVEGGPAVPAIASEAMAELYRDLISAAQAQDMNAIVNVRFSVQMVQDYTMQSGAPQQRGDRRVFADGAFLIIAQGDMVQANCDG